ncbi:MAG: hypothetical protein OEQ53_21425, partial [Saprospiraceae bacterium]|nr:hypothetical protein [Saprospiraceae bacterium]
SISCEADEKNVDMIIQEIENEINKLSSESIGEAELSMAKNYLSGYLLSLADGPFAMIEMLRSVAAEDLPLEYLNILLQQIHTLSEADIQEVSRKYLLNESLIRVVIH